MPALPSAADDIGLSAREEADPRDCAFPGRNTLMAQTLSQRAGFVIILLAFEATAASENDSET